MAAIKRLNEQFAFQANTQIYDNLNRVLAAIEGRLQPLEAIQSTISAAADSLIEVGLARMNETFTPLIRDAQERLEEFGANFSTTSTTSLAISTGEKVLSIAAADRQGYVYADYVSLRASAAPTNSMVCRVVSYDRLNGVLTVVAEQVFGSGTYAAWNIAISSAPDLVHAGRTDNPHAMTAAQVGAYTTAQVDAFMATLQTAVVGMVTAQYQAADANLQAALTLAYEADDDALQTQINGKEPAFPTGTIVRAMSGERAGRLPQITAQQRQGAARGQWQRRRCRQATLRSRRCSRGRGPTV